MRSRGLESHVPQLLCFEKVFLHDLQQTFETAMKHIRSEDCKNNNYLTPVLFYN